jgi:poly[(R)-3-hydroxyalkanoate] polymerase subunit PhaC
MYLNEINEQFEKIAQSNISMTNEFINSSLDAMNQANPFIFNYELIDKFKSVFEKNIAYTCQNIELFNNLLQLHNYTTMKSVGLDAAPVSSPDKSDRRFTDESWNENIVFDHIKQLYLIISKAVLNSTEDSLYDDEQTNLKIDFYTKQFLDAMSPTNFIATNPAVIKETIDSKGENLVNGAKALIDDIVRGKGKLLTPRMTDYTAFEVGKNVATTPGKVIYQNELMQLIQYTPTTKTVFETPLLIIPPWINKYYILDLRKENSFIQWAVDQGHSVFIISWKNPDESYADTQFEDYMLKGVLTALDKVKEETDVSNVNTIGYCIGGTLLAATNAYLAAKRRKPIKSTTYFTTLVDFEEPGDLGIFIDEQQLDALDATMKQEGYLDGSSMATVFNMLRSNDLIWPFFINNYLMGKEPTAFDLLYWNSDSTRLPEKTHSFYLRQCYLNNQLREPGGIELDGTPIDLGKIKLPTYFISTKEDHITPWKSTYSGAKLMSGDIRFVLGGSGHIAGIINPPVKNKYGFWTNNTIEEQADNWLENANYTEGSWWPDWQKWIKAKSGKKISARTPGKKLKVIEDAPGSYVKERIVDN